MNPLRLKIIRLLQTGLLTFLVCTGRDAHAREHGGFPSGPIPARSDARSAPADSGIRQKDTLLRETIRKLFERDRAKADDRDSPPDTYGPTIRQIRQDLTGHALAEGLDNGYHSADWKWVIEEGDIGDFRITEVEEHSDTACTFIAVMTLSEKHYSYRARVRIRYVSTPELRWRFDYVVSLGMEVIVTHEYDTCIRSSIAPDGWGGTYQIEFRNLSEMTLAVGGDFLSENGWTRFSTTVAPHGTNHTGGLFGGGSVSSYRINFIVRID